MLQTLNLRIAQGTFCSLTSQVPLLNNVIPILNSSNFEVPVEAVFDWKTFEVR